ncbi:hypothetical protein V6Z12_A12G206500 [Gossypium hirsutum]
MTATLLLSIKRVLIPLPCIYFNKQRDIVIPK